MLLSLAWRNLWRHGRRSALTAAVMALSLAFCMVILAWTDGIYAMMGDAAVTKNLGHVKVRHVDYAAKRSLYDTVHNADAVLDAVDGLAPTTAATRRLNGNALLGGEVKTTGAMLLGIDPAREAQVTELDTKVDAGAYLTPDDAGQVLVGEGLAERLSVGVGDELVAVTQAADGSMGTALYTIKGTFHSGNTGMDRMGAYVLLSDLQELLVLPDQVHEVVVLTEDYDHADVEVLLDAVRGVLTDPSLTAQPWWEVDPGLEDMMGMQEASSWITILFVFGVTVLAVVNTLLMSVFERTRELGVMRALGVRPLELVQSVVLEALLLSVLATVVGLVLGGLGDWYMVVVGVDTSIESGEGFEMANVTFDPILRAEVTWGSVIKPVVAVFFFSVVAAVWPAARAARLRPVEALRAD